MASCLNKRQEPLTDVDMLLMVEKGIRPGIFGSINRYAKANQKYMKDCKTLILFKTVFERIRNISMEHYVVLKFFH